MNVEDDRLSSLPDDLVHKILSFVSIKHAVKISVLSSRWRFIWASMPCLNFTRDDFSSLDKFSKVVTHVLSRRNNQIEVSSVSLAFRGKTSQAFVKRILNYAFSHNIQQLNVTCLPGKRMQSPLSVFSSQSLKSFTLTGCDCSGGYFVTTPPTWELPALTTLNLHGVILNADMFAGHFSNCANLKNLTLKRCLKTHGYDFNICHPRLSSLTLEDGYGHVKVVTPQLKHLAIKCWRGIHMISAPKLSSLHYKDKYYEFDDTLQLSTDLHLEKVDICIPWPYESKANARKLVCLLQQIRSVKFLTLNLELVKLLSSSVELITYQPSPFANLKSLKIYPAYVTPEVQTQPKVIMSTEVKSYLLDGSPSATFTMVSHEEIRAVKNVTSAQNLLRELHFLLKQWKENSETRTAEVKQDKAPMESRMATAHEQGEVANQLDAKVKWPFWERMKHINDQLERGYKYAGYTISVLRKIEGVLPKLPTSHQNNLQARFYGLCAEAEPIMDNMRDRLKTQCDKKP